MGVERTVEPVNVGTAVHVGFSHDTRIKGEDIQGDVHLGMGGVEECLFYLCSEGRSVDSREWDVVNKRNPLSRFRDGSENIDSTGEGTWGNGDV